MTITTDDNIIRIADQLRSAARMHIRDAKSVPATVFVVARENPVTGAPAKATSPIIPIVQPNTLNKDAFASSVRAVVLAARAQAVIFCADAWYVRLKDVVPENAATLSAAEKADLARKAMNDVPPSQHEDRCEAIVVSIEFDDGRVYRTHQPYVRDQGRILFENIDAIWVRHEENTGRFVFMFDPKLSAPPDEVVAQARNLSAYVCQGLDWIPVDWSIVTPEEEAAQVARG